MIFLALASLLISLPIVLPIPTLLGWKITLVVTEFSQWLVILGLVISFLSWRTNQGSFGVATILTVISSAIFFIPLGKTMIKAHTLPEELRTAFSLTALPDQSPPSLLNLWFGTRPRPITPKTLTYVNDEEGRRSLLFYSAQRKESVPCLLVIHSGGWENGRPEEFPIWNHHWIREGYAVASIQYRLAPYWKWPAPMEDVAAALTYLKAQAINLGINPSRFVLIGRSAGGQIATACASNLRDPAIRGCISLYAPADLPFARKYADPHDVLDSLRLLRQYLGGDPEQAEENYRTASATLTAEADFPPTLIVHGSRDSLVWCQQSRRLAARLKVKNVPHYYLELPWATHAFDFPFHGPGSHLTRFATDTFIRSVCHPAKKEE